MLSEEEIMEYVQGTDAVAEKKQFSPAEAKQIGDTLDICWDAVDTREFTIGLNVELDHGQRHPETDVTHDEPLLTATIALAHLDRIPDDCTRLAAMEYGANRTRSADRRGDL